MEDRALSRMNRVVVAIDFSEPSIHAASWVAGQFAHGVELVLVHVLERPPMPRFLAKRYPSTEQIVDAARSGAEARLRSLVERIATALVWPEVRVGRTDEEVVRVAAEYDADLIVVGRADLNPNGWGRIGTTAQRILRRSHLPIVVVAGAAAREAAPPPAHVLAGIDDSDMTARVLGWAAFLADRFQAEATVLHVLTPPILHAASALPGVLSAPDAPAWGHVSEDDAAATTEARQWLEERVRDAAPAARLTPLIVSGVARPAEAIIEAARDRDGAMIVIGSRGAGVADRLLFGSVAEAVLRDAPFPVLVVVPGSRTIPSIDRSALAASSTD